jgi:hypothetical protein
MHYYGKEQGIWEITRNILKYFSWQARQNVVLSRPFWRGARQRPPLQGRGNPTAVHFAAGHSADLRQIESLPIPDQHLPPQPCVFRPAKSRIGRIQPLRPFAGFLLKELITTQIGDS